MRRIVFALIAVLACLAAPASAMAATPFTAGDGAAPTVAVGPDGMGHVVWITTDDNAKVGYCRISPNGSACNRTELITFGPATEAQRAGSKARVFVPAPNKVVIVAGCWACGPSTVEDYTYRWISSNNGASFGEPSVIGNGIETNGFGTWLDDAGLSGTFVGASGSHVKAASFAGGDGVQYATGGIFVYGPEVTRVPGSNKLVAATNDLDDVKYGVYVGDSLAVGDINAPIGWQINKTLAAAEGDNSDTALNSGPNGVFLSYRYFVPNDNRVGLRRFDPATNTFGAPVYVEGPDPIDNNSLSEPDSYQDPAGRIHAAWSTLYGGGRLRYTVSDPSGGAFSVPATLAKSETFNEPEIAAGPSGQGFVTWIDGFTGPVRVVPIQPEAESGVTAPPADVTPPGVTGFDVSDTTLRPGQRAKFSFRSSEAGLAVLTFEKRFNGIKGKRKGKKGKGKAKTVCLPKTKKRLAALRRRAKSPKALRRKLKKLRCRGFRRIGEIRQAVKPGLNTIEFGGRVAGRKLGPGQYRASLVITDAAGNVSRTERLNFRVQAPKKAKRGKRRSR